MELKLQPGGGQEVEDCGGWKLWRVSNCWLTMRGLGVRSRLSSKATAASGTLRPKRVWALPMAGTPRSL